jgi:epoxyqueuosine reductase QueG
MSEVEQLKGQLDHISKLYDKLKSSVISAVPYVRATISPGNHFKSKERPDWIEIHAGRADQSCRFLDQLQQLAKEPD